MKYREGLLYALVLCLSACTNVKKSSVQDLRVDGLPIGDIQDVARIQIQTYKKDPKNILMPWWTATIIKFDGIELPKNHKETVLQTTPGEHFIDIAYSIEAEFNPRGKRIKNICQIEHVNLKAGKLIYINAVSSKGLGDCDINYGQTAPWER